ncbi:HicB family protein [Marinitenerispora sediminis]|uniref:HicB family protein n=1 Tax=Marinitenerispora sediminis TaxID=1931232 RepID=A0A368T4L3_9ACTN|nr:HicB family protein [Marinitenerispora sediminis]RCV55064.1 HicB family protein [Marinitenerispora sediminis]
MPAGPHYTQGKNLKDAEAMAADAVALLLDVDPATITVNLTVEAPEEARVHLRAMADAESARDEAERKRLAELAAAAQALVDAGMTVRDAGRVLGTSHQRVAQLTKRPGAPA